MPTHTFRPKSSVLLLPVGISAPFAVFVFYALAYNLPQDFGFVIIITLFAIPLIVLYYRAFRRKIVITDQELINYDVTLDPKTRIVRSQVAKITAAYEGPIELTDQAIRPGVLLLLFFDADEQKIAEIDIQSFQLKDIKKIAHLMLGTVTPHNLTAHSFISDSAN